MRLLREFYCQETLQVLLISAEEILVCDFFVFCDGCLLLLKNSQLEDALEFNLLQLRNFHLDCAAQLCLQPTFTG